MEQKPQEATDLQQRAAATEINQTLFCIKDTSSKLWMVQKMASSCDSTLTEQSHIYTLLLNEPIRRQNDLWRE